MQFWWHKYIEPLMIEFIVLLCKYQLEIFAIIWIAMTKRLRRTSCEFQCRVAVEYRITDPHECSWIPAKVNVHSHHIPNLLPLFLRVTSMWAPPRRSNVFLWQTAVAMETVVESAFCLETLTADGTLLRRSAWPSQPDTTLLRGIKRQLLQNTLYINNLIAIRSFLIPNFWQQAFEIHGVMTSLSPLSL